MSSVGNTLPAVPPFTSKDSKALPDERTEVDSSAVLEAQIVSRLTGQIARNRRLPDEDWLNDSPQERVRLPGIILDPAMPASDRADIAHANMDLFENAVKTVNQREYPGRQWNLKRRMCVAEQGGDRYLLVHHLLDLNLGVFEVYRVDQDGYPDKLEVDMIATQNMNAKIIEIIRRAGELELEVAA